MIAAPTASKPETIHRLIHACDHQINQFITKLAPEQTTSVEQSDSSGRISVIRDTPPDCLRKPGHLSISELSSLASQNTQNLAANRSEKDGVSHTPNPQVPQSFMLLAKHHTNSVAFETATRLNEIRGLINKVICTDLNNAHNVERDFISINRKISLAMSAAIETKSYYTNNLSAASLSETSDDLTLAKLRSLDSISKMLIKLLDAEINELKNTEQGINKQLQLFTKSHEGKSIHPDNETLISMSADIAMLLRGIESLMETTFPEPQDKTLDAHSAPQKTAVVNTGDEDKPKKEPLPLPSLLALTTGAAVSFLLATGLSRNGR